MNCIISWGGAFNNTYFPSAQLREDISFIVIFDLHIGYMPYVAEGEGCIGR